MVSLTAHATTVANKDPPINGCTSNDKNNCFNVEEKCNKKWACWI